MISVEEAFATILGSCRTLGLEKVDILEACGRVIGEDVFAPRDIPFAANSAMDGYAVRSADTRGAHALGPVELRVIETIAAGNLPQKTVKAGHAARIMTGAVLPRGADAVVRREDTDEKGRTVLIKVAAPEGLDIRFPGEDVRKGERVIAAGEVLRPGHIGMLAALGRAFVPVYSRPRVAILSTGDELVDIETEPAPGKIVNSNSYSLAAQVSACGGLPQVSAIVRDKKEELAGAFTTARRADVILSSGGVSMGDYDFVKDVMGDLGNAMHFWQVAMRPGKPLAFGSIDGTPLFGLPGNPVSVMVSFEQFVRPYLLKMQGHSRILRPTLTAVCAQDIKKGKGVKNFLRAVVEKEKDGYVARLTGEQGSGILKSMVTANAFIVLDEGITQVKKGENVTVQLLDATSF
ncbi:MAG: molybdopterin molybdotransferase MoeA [Smithellaceae bacterium]|nr:molybdopterin molybdotransferase MoeA [Syntrophaceae bacterium]MDD4239868.1 molybdopterin molybdotransferase MoeA [Smithellaceae bacterium]NLX52629.1 molybdopterin molybdotransferase MoeA [Deltaproteobacteria bacterium]